jgi:superfamily II DNA or RNA helicase
MLRKHQREFKEIIDGIIAGSPVKTIYCHCFPGSGKSILPIIAGKLIEAGLADRLIWIAPRLSLIDQAEREFINPYFRRLLDHKLQIRSSTNEYNPTRGCNGFATTLNAVGMDDERIISTEFDHHRYILICDEFHHIEEGSVWHKKIAPLFRKAAFRVMLSGTLQRGDDSRIAFLPYKMNGKGMVPDLQESADTRIIRYTMADALQEKAIIPLSFHLSDGEAEWETRKGRKVRVSSIEAATDQDITKALFTALHTGYADDLLCVGIQHFTEHKKRFPTARCLIVASSIEQAKRHLKNLKASAHNLKYDIATSEDSADAGKVIKRMKQGDLDVLVSVMMVYEGLNIPAVSHIICLTRIRSTPWIIQMAARANRIDPSAGPYERQIGHIFAPSDPLFKAIVREMETEQLMAAKSGQGNGTGKNGGDDHDGFTLQPSPGGIVPLSSGLTGVNQYIVGNGGLCDDTPELTISEQEEDTLNQIEAHIRRYSFNNRFNPKRLNSETFTFFGKSRRDMPLKELKSCLEWVRGTYPINYIRGTGRARVPTKAAPYACEWRV